MTTADLVIRGGKVVSPDSVIEASVAIKDGQILAVGAEARCRPPRETLDATGLHVLPGASTCTCISATRAIRTRRTWRAARRRRRSAASPPCSTCRTPSRRPARAELLAAKHTIAAAKAHVDFGLYALLGEDTIEHVPELVEGGVIGFKLYMGNTFGRFPRRHRRDAGSFEVVAPTGKRISLHAETNSIMGAAERLRMR